MFVSDELSAPSVITRCSNTSEFRAVRDLFANVEMPALIKHHKELYDHLHSEEFFFSSRLKSRSRTGIGWCSFVTLNCGDTTKVSWLHVRNNIPETLDSGVSTLALHRTWCINRHAEYFNRSFLLNFESFMASSICLSLTSRQLKRLRASGGASCATKHYVWINRSCFVLLLVLWYLRWRINPHRNKGSS